MNGAHVADEYVTADLYELSRELGERDPERQAHGFLGGEWGYGQDFENDVFEMHPYWWGDCECGHDDREAQWEDEHPHLDDCYQSELSRRGGYEHASRLADAWGLPQVGCAVHCTCGREEERREWVEANPHPPDCPQVRPNFRHKPSGIEVRWYKYIGRSMEVPEVTFLAWRGVMDECLASLSSGGPS